MRSLLRGLEGPLLDRHILGGEGHLAVLFFEDDPFEPVLVVHLRIILAQEPTAGFLALLRRAVMHLGGEHHVLGLAAAQQICDFFATGCTKFQLNK